jgi:hypothetical protein
MPKETPTSTESKSMEWIVLARLIAEVGMPIALWIARKVESGGQVQPGEIDELETMAATKPEDLAVKIITALGIPMDDPKAVSVLEKIGKTL